MKVFRIGIALALLLVARIGWRFVQMQAGGAAAAAGYGRSPLTLLVFGMLAGYYATYAAGLLRWKSRSTGSVPAPAPAAEGTDPP